MSVSYEFAGQTAIVTGGARGIGRAIVAGFVRAGAQVWIWDLDPIELDGAHSLTAGATVHGSEGYAAGKKVPTLVQVLNGEKPANSAPVTIDFVPGTKFRYSGGGYAIIQQILLDVTGEPFPELMQEVVLQPLHMVHSTFQQPIPDKLRPLIAMPYDSDGRAIEGGPHTYREIADAGLWTTASDLALFALAIQDALAGKSGAIVSPSTAHEMLRPVRRKDYALGFAIGANGPNRYFCHPGVTAGFMTFFFAYEKGDGMVVLTNGLHSKPLILEIVHALSKRYGWTEFPRESRFSNPWDIGVICGCIFLIAYLLFRVIRQRKRLATRK